jgi:transposase
MQDQALNIKQQLLFKKYFIEYLDEDGSKRYKINRDLFADKCLNFGYFILISNDNISPEETIHIYRDRDVIEKAFDNLKDRLECKRTEVHSNRCFDNKLFIMFLALIYISYIDKMMKKHLLYRNKTMEEIFDDLDNIKICFHSINNHTYTEITKKQHDLYQKFAVESPS